MGFVCVANAETVYQGGGTVGLQFPLQRGESAYNLGISVERIAAINKSSLYGAETCVQFMRKYLSTGWEKQKTKAPQVRKILVHK